MKLHQSGYACTLMIIIFLGLVTSKFASTDCFAEVPGGFTAVAVDDPGVVAAAKFAVTEHSKTEVVTLDKISQASRQVVAGLNYDLKLSVKVGTDTKTALVRVWAKLDKTHELSSWKYVTE